MARHVEDERSVDRPTIEETIGRAAGQALAGKFPTQRRLRRVEGIVKTGVDSGDISLGDGVEAIELERRAVELLLADERDRGRRRLERLAGDEVGEFPVEAGVEAGVGDVEERVGVLAGDLDRLPADDVGMAAIGEIGRVLETVVEPRAALDPVVAGELVPSEQVRLVEDEALGVLIGLVAGNDFAWPDDELPDRRDRL